MSIIIPQFDITVGALANYSRLNSSPTQGVYLKIEMQKLIELCQSKEFKSKWNKALLKFSQSEFGVSELDSDQLLSDLLNFSGAQFNRDFFLFSRGNSLMREAYKDGAAETDVRAKRQASALITAESASLKLENLPRFNSSMSHLQIALQEVFQANVSINLYYTPPYSNCFRPHVDPYNIFIFQISGEKKWFVDKPAPGFMRHEVHREKLNKNWSKNDFNVSLVEGDMLYLPTNSPHFAFTDESPSVHLTVGIHPVTAKDLVGHLLARKNWKHADVLEESFSADQLGLAKKTISRKSIEQLSIELAKELAKFATAGIPTEYWRDQSLLHRPFELPIRPGISPETSLRKRLDFSLKDVVAGQEMTPLQLKHLKKVLNKESFFVGELVDQGTKTSWMIAYKIATRILRMETHSIGEPKFKSGLTTSERKTLAKRKLYVFSPSQNGLLVLMSLRGTTKVIKLTKVQSLFFRTHVVANPSMLASFMKKFT